jgi:hypothetical protein
MFKNIEENHIIFENDDDLFQVHNYLYGSCHLFALELSKLTGFKVGAIFEDIDEGKSALVHAFCYHPENSDWVIDCRGVVEKSFIWDDYTSDSLGVEEIENAKDILNEWINDEIINNWSDKKMPLNGKQLSEQKIINTFIKNNIKKGLYPGKTMNKNKVKL